jgi:hypothetical protein
MKIDDKVEFLRRMHQNIMAKVYLRKGKIEQKEPEKKEKREFNYHVEWERAEQRKEQEAEEHKERLKKMINELPKLPVYSKVELMRLVDGYTDIRRDVIEDIERRKSEIKKTWPQELIEFVLGRMEEIS